MMRLTMVHIWRVMRSWRLPQLLLLSLILLCANLLLTNRYQTGYSKDHINPDFSGLRNFKPRLLVDLPSTSPRDLSGHPKLSLAPLLKESHHSVSPEPQVRRELSSGVQEEENSAREVIDGDGDREVRNLRVEDNAANEVNSVEPELNGSKRKLNGRIPTESFPNIQSSSSKILNGLESKMSTIGKPKNIGFHNWRNLTESEIDHLSVLGRRLYLNEDVGTEQNRDFTILIWKSGPSIERRLIKQYGKEKLDPFRHCSVKNCKITYEDSLANAADAIMIHLHRTKGPSSFPNRTNVNQRWIWLSDESPYHTFLVAKDKNMAHYNGYFNWSMSYRMESDIPVPYGRTIEMTEAESSVHQKVDYYALKSKVAAIMGSNCGGKNKRWQYVKELQKFMDLDVYGRCGTLKCPGHFSKDCESLKDYKFYLAFENGNCQEYITEKAWWNAMEKGAVPVVMGGKIEYYRKMLPPNSFIHIDEFQSPHHLADHLLSVAQSPTKYMRYHAWRSRFRIMNEHGYFGTDVFHYCRICEALNYNDRAQKIYDKMEVFWNKETQCDNPSWESRMKGT